MAKTYLKTTYTDGSPDQYADFSEYAAKMKVRVAQNYKNIKQILVVDKEEEGANVLQEIYKNPLLGMKVETVDTTAFANQISEKDAEIEKLKAQLAAVSNPNPVQIGNDPEPIAELIPAPAPETGGKKK